MQKFHCRKAKAAPRRDGDDAGEIAGAIAGPTSRARPAAPSFRCRRRRRRACPRRSRARGRGRPGRPRDQPRRDLPRRLAHGDAGALARVFRPRHRGAGISGLGLPALRPGFAAWRRGGAAHDGAGAARPRQGPRAAGDFARHRQRHPPARAAARDACAAVAFRRAGQSAGDVRRHPVARAQRIFSRRDRARGRRLCGPRRHHRSVRARHGRPGAARFLRRHAGIDPQLRSGNAAHDRGAAHARPRADGGIPAHHRDHPAVSHRLCRGVRRRHARRHALRSGERGPPRRRHGALAAAVSPATRDAVRLSGGNADRDRAARRGSRARAARADRRLLSGAQGGDGPGRRRRAVQAAAAGPALSARSRMARTARPLRAGAAVAVRVAGSERRCHRDRRPRRPQFRRRAERAEHQRLRGGEGARRDAASGRQARRHRDVERRLARAHGACAGRTWPAQSRAVASWPQALALARPDRRACRARHRCRLRDRRRRAHHRRRHSGRAPGAPAARNRSGRRISSPR